MWEIHQSRAYPQELSRLKSLKFQALFDMYKQVFKNARLNKVCLFPQLLLSPTPFLIGVTTEFWRMKRLKSLPSDIWLVDVDSGAISPPAAEFGGAKRVKVAGSGQQSPAAGVLPSIPGVVVPFDLPALPEAELKVLRHHLKQVSQHAHTAVQPVQLLLFLRFTTTRNNVLSRCWTAWPSVPSRTWRTSPPKAWPGCWRTSSPPPLQPRRRGRTACRGSSRSSSATTTTPSTWPPGFAWYDVLKDPVPSETGSK